MFTLFELQELCADEEKLSAFLTKYGVLAPAKTCTCGHALADKWYTDRGSAYCRCADRSCHRKVYGKADGILQHCHLSLKEWVHLAYFWAHNSAGGRAEDMLGRWINGAWSNLKNFLRARGGCRGDLLESSVEEFQWRTNLPEAGISLHNS